MKTEKNSARVTRFLGAGALAALAGTVGCNQSGGAGGGSSRTAAASAPQGPLFGATRSLSLVEARSGAAVAALDSGATVLVAGGRTPTAEATDTAEIVDASEAIATPLAARLATPRAGARAVTLPGGRVLVLGGHDARGKALASTEVWDGLAHAFGPGPDLAAPRDGAAIAFVSSSRVAILGGKGETSVEVLDLATLRTTKLAGELAHGHEGAQARVVGDRIVLAGGADAPEVFDPATGEARTPKRPDGSRSGEALVSIPGAVLLVGGAPAKGAADGQAHEIASPFEAIASVHAVGSPRSDGQSVAFGGGELVLGGRDGSGALAVETDLVDPSSLATKPGPSLSQGRVDPAAVALPNGEVLVLGGEDASGQPVATAEILLPPGAPAPDAARAFDDARSAADARSRLAALLAAEKKQIAADAAALASATATENAATDTILGLRRDLGKAQSVEQAQAQQLAAAKAQIAQLSAQLAQVQGQLATTQSQLAASQTQLATVSTQLAQTQQSLAQANAANQQAQAQTAQLNQTVAQENQTIAQDNQTISTLQGQLAAARTTAPAPSPAVRDFYKPLGPAPSPAPVATPGPPTATITTFPGPLTPFGDAYVDSVSPNPARAGQQVQLGVTQGHAPVTGGVQVYFDGVPATVSGAFFNQVNGYGTINVTVPNVASGLHKVQFTAGNYVSHTFTFTVQ